MKMKNTKRSLLLSGISLLLCASMFVGSTFAWFTDTVSSGRNIIQSGNLDVELYYALSAEDAKNDKWEMVTAETNVFGYTLWEPGYTKVAYFKVVNKGSLALKYQLTADVFNETAGKNKLGENGEPFLLSDYLYTEIVDVNATRDDILKLTGTKFKGSIPMSEMGKLVAKGKEDATEGTVSEQIIGLAIWMPTSVGNEANHDGKNIPTIQFGINLVATQLDAEIDSFGPDYDKDAAWDGTYPTEMPESVKIDDATKTVYLEDSKAFAFLGSLRDELVANHGGRVWEWTVELKTDVNLLNQPWTPITLQGYKEFNGNGHTISNIHVTSDTNSAGLFANITNGDSGTTYFKNLNLDGVYVKGVNSVGALSGSSSQGIIENVTVNNATLIGVKYVGGIFGSGNGSVNNSTVKNSTIRIDEVVYKADGSVDSKEAGGLIGYLSNDGNATTENKIIANNLVENVTVIAPSVASGLVSQPNSSNVGGALIEVRDNTMKNVTVTTSDATADLFVSNNVGGKSLVENNTADENCKIAALVSTADALVTALTNGTPVVLADDVTLDTDTSIVIASGVKSVLNLNGHTISEANTRTATHNFMIDVKGGELTVTDGTISMNHTGTNMGWNGATTVIDVTAGGVLNLQNVTVENKGGTDMNFGVHLNNWGEVTLNADNCVFDATYCGVRVFNSGYDMNNVKITNSTLKGATRAFWVHNYIGDLNSAQHSDDAIKARLNLDIYNNNNTFEITGTAVSPIRYGFGTTVYFDESGEKINLISDPADLDEALANGDDVVLSDDIENVPVDKVAPYGNYYGIAQNGGVFDGNGKILDFDAPTGDNYGIMTSGGTIKNVTITGVFRGIMIMYPTEDIVLDNVVIGDEDVCYAINTGEGDGTHSLTVTNSTIRGWNSYGTAISSVSFTNCKFEQGTYYTNIYGRLVKPYVNAVFDSCEFGSKFYIDLSQLGKDGDHNVLDPDAKITLKNCTVNGVKLTAENWTELIADEDNCSEGQISIEAKDGTFMTATNILDYVTIQ